jgi:hypothetical protein
MLLIVPMALATGDRCIQLARLERSCARMKCHGIQTALPIDIERGVAAVSAKIRRLDVKLPTR